MSQPNIISAFSCFYIPPEGPGNAKFTQQPDRQLERLLIDLTRIPANFPPDIWARYFLLILRQQDARLAALLELMNTTQDRLLSLIERLAAIAPNPNQNIPTLHRHCQSHADQRSVQQLFAAPPTLSSRLLNAYLQQSCWYAAQYFYHHRIRSMSLGDRYSLAECFQLAAEQANNPSRLLRNFDFRQTNQIRTYAEQTLKDVLRDIIYQQEHLDKNSSDWGLLRYVTKRELTAALSAAGCGPAAITQACLVWTSFKDIYQTKLEGRNQLPDPSEAQLHAIADRYNQHRQKFKLEKIIQGRDVLTQLKAAAQAVRNYRHLNVTYQALIDTTTQTTETPLEQLMQREESNFAQALDQLFQTEIAQVFVKQAALAQKVLQLFLGLDFTQNDILRLVGSQLGLQKQYQLARQIARYKRVFLQEIAHTLKQRYAQALPEDKPGDTLIDRIHDIFTDYLTRYCKKIFYRVLSQKCQELATETVLPQPEILIPLLQNTLKQQVETTLEIDLGLCSSADETLATFVTAWLENQTTLEN